MREYLRPLVILAGSLLGLWAGLALTKYIAPFLISMGAALLAEPAVSALRRRGVPRGVGAGITTAMVLLVTAGALGCCALGCSRLVSSYARRAPELLAAMEDMGGNLRARFLHLLRDAPEGLARDLMQAADTVSAQLEQVPAAISQKALESVTGLAKQSSDWLLFVCTAIIGIYFFSACWPELRAFAARQLPGHMKQKLRLVWSVLTGAAAGYLKVQCILSGVTFLILLGAFRFMDIPDGASTAAVIAIVDALPVLGSGAVLLPWAAIALALGRVPRAVGLVLVYGVLLLTHNLLQTKLMGDHLGLHPVTALVSLYAGWKLWGFGGMLLLPVACVLITSLNRAGVIHLYK